MLLLNQLSHLEYQILPKRPNYEKSNNHIILTLLFFQCKKRCKKLSTKKVTFASLPRKPITQDDIAALQTTNYTLLQKVFFISREQGMLFMQQPPLATDFYGSYKNLAERYNDRIKAMISFINSSKPS